MTNIVTLHAAHTQQRRLIFCSSARTNWLLS